MQTIKYGIGLDMQCNRVVTKVRIVEQFPTNASGYDCIIATDGIKMYAKVADFYDTADAARAAL